MLKNVLKPRWRRSPRKGEGEKPTQNQGALNALQRGPEGVSEANKMLIDCE